MSKVLVEHVKNNGGATITVPMGVWRRLNDLQRKEILTAPPKGFAVAAATKEHAVVEYDDNLDLEQVTKNIPEDKFVGLWHNNEDNKVYVDEVVWTEDKREALALAAKNNQIAIFDLNNMVEIRL